MPTYSCAPNFAYIMAADAKSAVQRVNGVSSVVVELDDHFASNEINDGLAQVGTSRRPFRGMRPAKDSRNCVGSLRARRSSHDRSDSAVRCWPPDSAPIVSRAC